MHIMIDAIRFSTQVSIQRCAAGLMFGGKAAGLRVYRKVDAVGAAET